MGASLRAVHTLWCAFAKFYEDHGDVENARVILEKATAVAYVAVDDLAAVWCAWAEMELRHDHYDEVRRRQRWWWCGARGGAVRRGRGLSRVCAKRRGRRNPEGNPGCKQHRVG